MASSPHLPVALLTTFAFALLIILCTSPAVRAGEFDIGEVCGKLNGDGYTNHFMCSQDRKSVVSIAPPIHPKPPSHYDPEEK